MSEKAKKSKTRKKTAYVKRKPVESDNEKTPAKPKNQIKTSKKAVAYEKNGVKRDANGRILPGSKGNGGGRPKGSLSNARVSELRQAIYRVEVERRKPKNKRKFNTWIEHQVNKSYDDTKIAVAMLHKMYATLKNVEQTQRVTSSVFCN
jgi:hypothetical protein